jgi:HSP20 family protein
MANVIRWDPFGEMVHLHRAMDRVLDERFARPWRTLGWENGEAFLPLDVYETEDELVVKASLPGFKPEDVDVSITGDTLTIKGEYKAEEETKKRSYYRQEHRYGSFHRAITLPTQIESGKAEAVFEHGVLTLTMPKAESIKPKTIKVKARGMIEGEKK